MTQRSALRELLAELSRRRVTRVAAVYLVAAWAVIQVSDTVLPRLGVPDWGVTLVIVVAALGLPVAIALAWAFDITPDGIQRASGDVAPRRSSASGRAPAYLGIGILIGLVGVGTYARFANGPAAVNETERSIAVLPFVDMSSAQNQAYFADGMTEELLNALARIESLHVAARTSSFAFKGKNLPIREVAAQLGVQHVLEGSVRREGDRLRITAQLIKADDGYHVWSDTYDRQLSDVFAVQEEISRAIARALRAELGIAEGETLVRDATTSTAAHDLYLRGRYHWNRRTPADLRRAAELMEQAVALDPQYARAWAQLAAAYELIPDYDTSVPREQYLGRARAAIARALEIDPQMGVAHSVRGDMMLHYDWDFAGSEREHRIALKLVPRDATAHSWYAEVLEVTNRVDEALEHRTIALQLEPLDPKINVDYAGILLWLGRHEEAIARLDSALALDRDYEPAHHQMVVAAALVRDWDRLETALARLFELQERDPALATVIAGGLRSPARRDSALAIMRPENGVAPIEVWGAIYMALGAHDDALALLEAAVAARFAEAPWIPTHPAYAPLRTHPRFIAIAERIGLAEVLR